VLITKFDHDPSRAVGSARHKRCSWPIGARQEQWLRAYPQATAAQAATLAPRPPFNARVETVTTKPFFREPFTPNGGLVVQSGARSLRHRDAIISLAARHKLPSVFPSRYFVTGGGLISYGPDLTDQFRQAAGYVDRILKGEKPADLPVQAPTKFELAINLKTAKALGLTVPDTLLARADEVIE